MHSLRPRGARRAAALALVGTLLAGCGGKTTGPTSYLPSAASHDAAAAPQQLYRAQMAHLGGVPARTPSSPSLAHRRAVRDVGGALPAITVNVLWEVDVGDGYSYNDLMSTPTSSERAPYPSAGQTWYLPTANIAGTAPLYRLYHPGYAPDHMDSPTAGEGGFNTEGVLGNPFTSGVAGTAPIYRYVNPSVYNDDHSTPGPHNLPSGYTREGPMYNGYPRWGLAATANVQFSGGGITAQVNQVAGASVWSWVWNGIEFVNTHDYGREIQSAFFYNNQNPTEAGDAAVSGDPEDMHGSPVASLALTADGISTRAVPMEWNPGISGASSDQAALYNTVLLGKDIHLNYNNMGAVAQYVTSLTLPNAVTGGSLEMPTGYLQAGFNRFYTFDSSNGAMTEVHPPVCNTGANVQYTPPSGYGGVIISNANQTAAQGIYGATNAAGGPATYFTLWDFTNGGCAFQTSKWDIVASANNGAFPAGTSTYNSYVVTGTLAQVQSLMRSLYGTR